MSLTGQTIWLAPRPGARPRTLNAQLVRRLRCAYARGGLSYAALGRLFGLSARAARAAALGLTWQSVT